MTFPWTEASVARLKALREEHRTAGEMKDILASEFGCECSRGAVIGKLRRMGLGTLSGVVNQNRPQPKPQPKPSRIASQGFHGYRPGRKLPAPRKKSAVTAIATVPAESFRCTLLDLTNESCRWPIGDPWKPEFRFCGAPGADFPAGRPYCPCHQRMAWARAA